MKRKPRHAHAPGTPSWSLTTLQEHGQAARLGYLLAASGQRTAPCVAARLDHERERRAELYDAELGKCLDLVERVRDAMGDVAAQVLEARYIDGAGWKEVASLAGLTTSGAVDVARRAMRMLDAEEAPTPATHRDG